MKKNHFFVNFKQKFFLRNEFTSDEKILSKIDKKMVFPIFEVKLDFS